MGESVPHPFIVISTMPTGASERNPLSCYTLDTDADPHDESGVLGGVWRWMTARFVSL